MPSQRNVDQLKVLTEKLAKAKSVVFVDHNGMSVADMQGLRAGVRDAGGEVTVAKNTLLKLMLEQKVSQVPQVAQADISKTSEARGTRGTSSTHDTFLSGPTSILFSYQDEILPIKVLAKFSADHEKPVIKAGFLGEKPLTKEEVIELSKLPGFNELIVKLMGTMQGPMVGLVNVLQGNARKLVWALQAIKEKNNKKF